MLFHVTATHTEENCPAYNLDRMPELIKAGERSEEMAKQLNIKVHFFVNGAPEHVFYALLEADNPASVAQFMGQGMPIRSSFKVTPVQHLEETLAMARRMMEQGRPG